MYFKHKQIPKGKTNGNWIRRSTLVSVHPWFPNPWIFARHLWKWSVWTRDAFCSLVRTTERIKWTVSCARGRVLHPPIHYLIIYYHLKLFSSPIKPQNAIFSCKLEKKCCHFDYSSWLKCCRAQVVACKTKKSVVTHFVPSGCIEK